MSSNGFNKAKVQGFIKEWEKIEDEASSEIGKIMSKVKDKKNDILDAAEQIGIKKRVMRNVITEKKLRNKADGMRDAFADNTEDEDIIDMRDNAALAAGLPLFDAVEAKTPKKKAEKKAEAKKPDLKAVADAMDGKPDGAKTH